MLIGLTGAAGSGKDTAGAFIVEHAKRCKLPARRDAFADRLKISAARSLGISGTPEECIAFCNDLKRPDRWIAVGHVEGGASPLHVAAHHPEADLFVQLTNVTGREFLQYYGTEAHREVFGYSFWVDVVLDRYDPSEILVVTDVRFDNEAEAVRAQGGVNWEVVRDDNKIGESRHASEQGISRDLVDHVFTNDSSLDAFEDDVLAKFEQQLYSYSPLLTEAA